MAQFKEISPAIQNFIANQKLFFIATAASEGRVNVSPKGLDTFKILDKNRVIWLSLTGSGNETAAHLAKINRITIMFCSFQEPPLILRLYGNADIIHPRDEKWEEMISHFPFYEGRRQVFDVNVEMVQTSCGFGVPLLSYEGERELLKDWGKKKTEAEIIEYWEKKNAVSIDGFSTQI